MPASLSMPVSLSPSSSAAAVPAVPVLVVGLAVVWLLLSSRLLMLLAVVVLAVASLHFYLAPIADVPRATRALVFAARTKPECQHVLLKNAVAMAAVHRSERVARRTKQTIEKRRELRRRWHEMWQTRR